MKKFKLLIFMLITILSAYALVSCGGVPVHKSDRLSIVATIFPAYDFSREICGGRADIKMLLRPGAESHSYEPTPQDIIAIQNCDIFIYVGGESDEWVNDILSSIDLSDIEVIPMMECVDAVEEDITEGMEVHRSAEDEEKSDTYEPEYDEHVWTSPVNAAKITETICNATAQKDLPNAQYYRERAEEYVNKLNNLDKEFRQIADNSKRRVIVFGDRFPCRYFADEYGLKYYAAFPGCSAETEASARTIAFLIDKVNDEGIPIVLYPELSNMKVAKTICESTSAKCMQFSSCHNVTADEFESGVSYLSLMTDNAKVLKEALN